MERRMRIAYTHTHTRTQEESRNKRERESPSIDRRASLYASHAIRFWVGGGVREGRMKTWGTKKRDIVLKRKVATYNLSQMATSIFRYKYQVFLISSALDRAYGVISIDCFFFWWGVGLHEFAGSGRKLTSHDVASPPCVRFRWLYI